MKKTLLTLLPLLFFTFCFAQTPPCFTDQLWTQAAHNDSALYFRKMADDLAIAKLSNEAAARYGSNKSSSGVTVIPTVIYVITDSSSGNSPNISMQQILSQMDQLNKNFEPYGYRFCMAKRNLIDSTMFAPNAGDSAGVFRISNALTNVSAYSQDAQLKALSHLPSQSYLRIFVVNSITPNGILGYAYFPGGNPSIDGIVVRSDVFGSNTYCPSCTFYPQYNLGATLTHEVGHYLNLFHTFQGGCLTGTNSITCQTTGDLICDTPPTDGSFGCPFPAPLCGTDTELIEDYMDYTFDACKDLFTFGQKQRMDYSTLAYRGVLISTENLIKTGVTCVSFAGSYANFSCPNFQGCLNDTMAFTSLGLTGFVYHWYYGDGDSSVGSTGYHIYTSTGQFPVTLVAVNAAQNISESSTTTAFVSACTPINCAYNKWSFNYGYLDFSSGRPIATNHTPTAPTRPFADFYLSTYRADTTGRPLFTIDCANNDGLFDTSLNLIDTLGGGPRVQVFPVPGHYDKYCAVRVAYGTDIMSFSILQAANGSVHALAGKKDITIPQPLNQLSQEFPVAGIPSCDGSRFFFVVQIGAAMKVYEVMSNDTVLLRQTYSIIGGLQQAWYLIATPNGRKLVLSQAKNNTGHFGFYVFDFDKSTGTITHETFLDDGTPPYNQYNYASEVPAGVSPNSRFIYQEGHCCQQPSGNTGYLYQYDLYNADPMASRKAIFQFPFDGEALPALDVTLGPDNKLYVGFYAHPNNTVRNYTLGVINYPDVLENGLNSTGYNPNGPYIIPPNCPYNGVYITAVVLPLLLDNTEAFGCYWKPNAPPVFEFVSTSCETYKFHSDDCYSHTWNFGDPNSGGNNTSTLSDPTHVFSAPGDYPVSLSANGQNFYDTIHIGTPPLALASSPVTNCPVVHANYSIVTLEPNVTYNWTITNGTPATASNAGNVDIQWTAGDTTGTITIVATDTVTGCTSTMSFPQHFFLPDSNIYHVKATICLGDAYRLGHQNIFVAGNYVDTLVARTGCDSIVYLQLTTTPRQTPVITAVGDSLSTGVYSSYQWLRNGVAIPNATNRYYIALLSGSYQVVVRDPNGFCNDTASATILSTDDLSGANVSIYPNPTSGELNINISGLSDRQMNVSVYDVCGRVVQTLKEEAISGNISMQVELNDYANGIYFLHLKANGFNVVRKIVLKR
ncbi:MAG: hypothetical protein JWO06_706 [Bacteroidota bacterium]|nr:hypothetical protein [Bacteroidota bacterium]